MKLGVAVGVTAHAAIGAGDELPVHRAEVARHAGEGARIEPLGFLLPARFTDVALTKLYST